MSVFVGNVLFVCVCSDFLHVIYAVGNNDLIMSKNEMGH